MTHRAVDGTAVSDAEVLDQLRGCGAILISRGPDQGPDDGRWAADLQGRAGEYGMQLVVRTLGYIVLIVDRNAVSPTCASVDGPLDRLDDAPVHRFAEAILASATSGRSQHPGNAGPRLRLVECLAEPVGSHHTT